MQVYELYNGTQHQWRIFGRDPDKPEGIIDTNQILVTSGERAMLVEPGGIELFSPMLRAVLEYVEVEAIQDLFASHQDPDIVSSLGLWDNVLPQATLHAPWMWEGFIRHFGCEHITYNGIPDEGATIRLGRLELEAIPAHYLHSSGNFQLLDRQAGILMSGDVGMAIEPGQEGAGFFCEDFDSHTQYMAPLHQRWMPSSEAVREWVDRVAELDIRMLVPQHGRILYGEDVPRFLEWFRGLEVGRVRSHT